MSIFLDRQGKLKVLRARLQKELGVLDETIGRLEREEFASASLSGGEGARSYSRKNLAEFTARRQEVARRLQEVCRRLQGRPLIDIRHRVTLRG